MQKKWMELSVETLVHPSIILGEKKNQLFYLKTSSLFPVL